MNIAAGKELPELYVMRRRLRAVTTVLFVILIGSLVGVYVAATNREWFWVVLTTIGGVVSGLILLGQEGDALNINTAIQVKERSSNESE